MKLLASLSVLAFALSAFAQNAPTQSPTTTQAPTIKIKSKGDDIRTVIDSIFEQAGKQYVLETNFHQSIFMNLEGATFQKAIEIIGNVASVEFEERQGVWYIRTKLVTKTPTTKTPLDTDPSTRIAAKTPAKPLTKTPLKPTTKKTTKGSKKAPVKSAVAAQPFANITKIDEQPVVTPIKPTVDLNGKLTVQLKKMDIREVFGEFGRQTSIEIEIDETVPNYKLDAYFYNTSLKFALDKVCKVAGLKYSFTPSKTVRISKA